VDEEGDWTYQGNRITREDILQLFYDNLHPGPHGGFVLEWQNTHCALEVVDTPFVVSRVDRVTNDEGDEEIRLTLRHLPRQEVLAPSGLWIGRGNVLYCRVRGGAFPARFSRAAYYQIAAWIEEGSQEGEFCLCVGPRRYAIRSESER
jgi:hypothetical protein